MIIKQKKKYKAGKQTEYVRRKKQKALWEHHKQIIIILYSIWDSLTMPTRHRQRRRNTPPCSKSYEVISKMKNAKNKWRKFDDRKFIIMEKYRQTPHRLFFLLLLWKLLKQIIRKSTRWNVRWYFARHDFNAHRRKLLSLILFLFSA